MAKMKDKREKRKRKVSDARKRAEQRESNFTGTAFKLPEGVGLHKFTKEGSCKLDIMPYEVSVDFNPGSEKGFYHYETTFPVHFQIGPKGNSYVCMAELWGKPCPVCDHQSKMKLKGGVDKDLFKSWYPKKRQLFAIKDVTSDKEAAKGLQIHENAVFNFGAGLEKKIKLSDEEQGYNMFHDPDNPYRLRVGVSQESFAGKDGGSTDFYKGVDFEFIKRKPYSDEELAEVPDLDRLLLPPCMTDELREKFDSEGIEAFDDDDWKTCYKELKKVFLQTGAIATDDDEEEGAGSPDDDEIVDDDEVTEDEEEVEEEEPPKAKKAGKKAKVTAESLGITKGCMVEHDEHGECEVGRIAEDGLSATLIDENNEKKYAVPVSEMTLLDSELEEEEEPEPPKKTTKAGKKKPVVEEEEEEEEEEPEDSEDEDEDDDELPFTDDDEEEEEEEPEPPKKKGGKKK